MPPIQRLIENIEGIEIDFIAQCLGVDTKKYKFKSTNDEEENDTMVPSAILKTETFKSLETRAIAKLIVVCPNCFTEFHFPGVVSRENA